MIDESRGPSLLMAAYFLTVAAWTFSSPPGSAPDEAAHYIRAAAVSTGDFLPEGRPEEFPGGETSRSIRWMLRQARLVSLPGALSPETFRCRGIPGRILPCTEKAPRGTVTEVTYVGTYPPTPYLVPAAFMRTASSGDDALVLARGGSALVCWLLLAAAMAAAWNGRAGWISLVGVTLASSPMVIYMASSLSGSGLETAASICFLACLLRLARTPANEDRKGATGGGIPWWVWTAAASSGALLAASRDLGVIWLGLHLSILFGWAGIGPAWATFRSGGRASLIAAAVVAVSVGVSVAWQVVVQVRPPFSFRDWLTQMQPSLGFFFSVIRQQIGLFGPLDTVMPVVAYAGWLALTLLALSLALGIADGRKRLVVSAAVLGTAGVTVALDAVQRTVGFGVQGRYLLPMAVAIPIMSGEILSQRADRLEWLAGRVPGLIAMGTLAAVLFLGWYTLGRRYSVGLRGPLLFFEGSAWSPPWGWAPWGSAAAVGALLILATGLVFSPRPSAPG